jgi:hypothetical protein
MKALVVLDIYIDDDIVDPETHVCMFMRVYENKQALMIITSSPHKSVRALFPHGTRQDE